MRRMLRHQVKVDDTAYLVTGRGGISGAGRIQNYGTDTYFEMWMEYELGENTDYLFQVFATNQEVPEDAYYMSTAVDTSGNAFHLYVVHDDVQ